MKLLLSETPTSLWYSIIQEAETVCMVTLKEELESYLVFLLMRYIDKPDVVRKIIATEVLQSMSLHSYRRQTALQEIGDHCLLFSGLFPHLAQKRLVKISYF